MTPGSASRWGPRSRRATSRRATRHEHHGLGRSVRHRAARRVSRISQRLVPLPVPQTQSGALMHIIRFEAQNIQRLSAVTIEPSADASAVVLAGANEEGKSSVLDSIEMALGGEKVLPPEPIRRGQEKAQIVVDLGDMIVTRRFTAKGSSLTVTNREGLSYPSPQALLNGFYNKLSFDPLAFAHAKADEQAGILRRLAGLDTKDLDDARKKLFEARTIANRDVARATGALATADHYPDVS